VTKAETPGDPLRGRITGRPLTWLIVALMLAQVLSSMNQTVLAPLLPVMSGELGGASLMYLVFGAYVLSMAVAVMLYGKGGDLVDRKTLMTLAVVVFVVGSTIAALAPSVGQLIVGRFVQGVGGGGIVVLAQAIVAAAVAPQLRGKYVAIMNTVYGFASVGGPLLGGWLADGPGWRWAFWISLPVGALAVVIIARAMPSAAPAPRAPGLRVDAAGAALMCVATSSVVLMLTWGGTHRPWSDPWIIALAALAAVSVCALLVVERHASDPLIPPVLFLDRNFVLPSVAGLLLGIVMLGVVANLPTYLQMAAGVSAATSGAIMIPMIFCMTIAGLIAGQRMSRTGRSRWMLTGGAGTAALATALLARLVDHVSPWSVGALIGLLGTGLGFSMIMVVVVAQNAFPDSLISTVTGVSNYARQIGMAVGATAVGGIFTSLLLGELRDTVRPDSAVLAGFNDLTPALVAALPTADRLALTAAYTHAYSTVFLWLAPCALVAAVCLAFVREEQRSSPPPT